MLYEVITESTQLVSDVTCYAGNDGAIDVTLSGGTLPYSYNWSNGQTTEDASSLTSGYYTYLMTDAQGCTIGDTVFVDQPDMLDINYEITPVSCVDQTDASIFISPFGGRNNFV